MSDLQFTAMVESAFTFENINKISAINVEILNSTDSYLVGAIRLSSGVFYNITVKNNAGNSILVIEESSVLFKGISVFINNSANKGSTLMITLSTVAFNGFTLLRSNRCKSKGGAMSIIKSNVTFTGKTKLSSNSAKDGGAIQLDRSDLESKGLIVVSGNWATKRVLTGQVFGGAISSTESSITMTGTVTFNGNHIHAGLLLSFGGAISAQRSTITLSGIVHFHDNYAKSALNLGGAILLSNSTLAATGVTLILINNTAQTGGAIAITGLLNPSPSTIKVEGTTLFDANVAISGGALYGTHSMYIQFFGNTTLSRNEGQTSGASQIAIGQTSMADIQFNGHTEIKDSVSTGATVSFQGNVRVLFNGTTKFINNTGLGGVLEVLDNNATIIILGQSYFKSNHGGTVVLKADSKPSNPSLISGEAVFIDNDSGISLAYSEIDLEGNFNFTENQSPSFGCINAFGSKVMINGTVLMNSNTGSTGPAIYSYNSSISMHCRYCHFAYNSAVGDGGAVFALRTTIYLYGIVRFTSNSASNRGGTIWAVNSDLYFSGHHDYVNNSANAGGVFSLGLFAVIDFDNLAIVFDNNRAERGAIIHHDDILSAVDCLDDAGLPAPINPLSIRSQCFFSTGRNVNITNIGNKASDIGNVLFGGNLRRCNRKHAAEIFITLFHTDDSIQNITSNPYQIVFCRNDRPLSLNSGSSRTITISTVPGKLFSVSVAGLNQLLTPISTIIRAEISAESNLTARLGSFQSKQQTKNSCTRLNYHVFSQAPNFDLILYAEGPCNKLGTAANAIAIKLEPCPDGFELVGDECTCEADLLKYTTMCDVNDELIQNSGNFWAGGLYDDNGSYVGIMTFPNCPFDYCVKETVNFTLQNPDKQCAHNRSGSICGQCMVNYSLTFGDVQCSDCSKTNPGVTLGYVLLFALVGIILVILLILLKMTVASGTLNGLIFYANIVDANRDIFIPQGGWLRVFISWLNLDFGFSTCFYSGMDMYGYTWLQFLFPFYIWMLIVILIVISRRSAWVTKRVGSNPVAVLATLILLSYAKLLRTVITVLYFATLQLSHGQTSTVWLYDGNVPYLRGKHLALFMFALLFFILLFLPYNFLLVVGPWLQNISGERENESKLKALVRKILVGWCEDYRIKSYVDTHTVVNNPKHQYWTGMFLMLRCILFIVFVTSAFRNSSATLMAVTTSLLVILFLTRVFTGRVYKNWYVDILEGMFLLNLGILSVATSHNMVSGGNQQLVANLSGGTSLILFLLILVYHIFKQVKNQGKILYRMISTKLSYRRVYAVTENDCQVQLLHSMMEKQEPSPMTTVISLPSE
jgi:predicted outer membrane repeat protein